MIRFNAHHFSSPPSVRFHLFVFARRRRVPFNLASDGETCPPLSVDRQLALTVGVAIIVFFLPSSASINIFKHKRSSRDRHTDENEFRIDRTLHNQFERNFRRRP